MKKMSIEEQMNVSADLLQIAKDYCEFNIDKSKSISVLLSLIEIVLNNQKNVIADIDKIML